MRPTNFNHYHVFMKNLKFLVSVLLMGAVAMQSVAQDCCKKNKRLQLTKEAAALLANLKKSPAKGVMFGHQDDTFYGVTWAYEKDRSDIKDLTGDYPAVMGFELGWLEKPDTMNLDSVPFAKIREEAIKQYERGGVVTISWHPDNIVTKATKSAWDVSRNDVVTNILPYGYYHEEFMQQLDRVADFLASIKTKDGVKVPIIFRPWHENSGSWFWWGEKLCTKKQYQALYIMTQQVMNKHGLDNLIWAYSPGIEAMGNKEKFLERYPGDEYVDLLGFDGYQWGTEEEYKQILGKNLPMLVEVGKEHDKAVAITEMGFVSIPTADWWTRVVKPFIDENPVSYLLVWRNYKKEYFAPYPKQTSAKDFVKFYKAKNTLFSREAKQLELYK